jgi:hypothetical protein
VKDISGKELMLEQSAFTTIPSMRGSTSSLGPTRREVPESMTALYLDASIFLVP